MRRNNSSSYKSLKVGLVAHQASSQISVKLTNTAPRIASFEPRVLCIGSYGESNRAKKAWIYIMKCSNWTVQLVPVCASLQSSKMLSFDFPVR